MSDDIKLIEKYWQQLSDEWQGSKQPQKVFCEQRQISYSQFGYWRNLLIKRGIVKRTDSNAPYRRSVMPGFVKVGAVLERQLAKPMMDCIELTLPYGITIRIPAHAAE